MKLRELILKTTNLTPVLNNRLKLHLITPKSPLWTSHDASTEPYYGFLWPGGYGLTKYVYDNPTLFRNKSVLEIGSGCGSAAIAALQMGAARVVANDIDPAAGVAMELNAVSNHSATPEFLSENVLGSQTASSYLDQFDVVMFGDMLYSDSTIFELVSAHKGVVYMADPVRHVLRDILEAGSSKSAIREMLSYPLPHDPGEDPSQCNDGFSFVKIYSLNKD